MSVNYIENGRQNNEAHDIFEALKMPHLGQHIAEVVLRGSVSHEASLVTVDEAEIETEKVTAITDAEAKV